MESAGYPGHALHPPRSEDSSTSALTLAQSLLLEGPTITDMLQGTSSSTKNDYTLTIETP
jgi:hypothetical protein